MKAQLGEQLRTQQPMTSRMMHLNLFLFGCGHHRGPGGIHIRRSNAGDIRYYEQWRKPPSGASWMRSFLPTATPLAMSRTVRAGF